ncbi:MAG TPA: hydroxysqualene dehydroxylase HpnE [Roseiarcus sp.]|nr:hydroxysqualene dehydroxylase HpnE [Roseiarcus sp.]
MREGTVHVIGAGLAGLSAAVRLTGTGVKTVVHEAAAAAGGRCKSFFDPALGAEIDNGNHLILSGNQAALDYLTRIGSSDLLSGPGAALFDFADLQTGERWQFRPNEGRAPWWLFDRKRRAPGTSLQEYFAPLPIFWSRPNATVERAMRCEGPLYERLWRPLLLAGLNTDPKESSALLAGALLRETLGGGGKACRPLIASEGLSPTFVDPATLFIAGKGGTVRLGDRLRDIRFEADRAVALVFESEPILLGRDDAVVVAIPPWGARVLLPGVEAPEEFRGIVNAHFLVPAPKRHPPILGVIGGLTQWLFAYRDRLSVTISAAGDLIEWSREALAESIWREVAELTGLAPALPPCRIVKEKRATFAATPAQDARRPPSRTQWSNVFLAGDWVQTGLPATIEGAVRSGREAASLALATAAKPKVFAGAAVA